jgi:hypothetical protein
MPVEHLRPFQPAQAGQLEVEQDQVDGGAAVLLDGLHDRAGFEDVGRWQGVAQQQAQAGAEKGVVVDQEQSVVLHQWILLARSRGAALQGQWGGNEKNARPGIGKGGNGRRL